MDAPPPAEPPTATDFGAGPARAWGPVERRGFLAIAILLGCALAYGLVLVGFDVASEPQEHSFGASATDARLEVYLQPLHVDQVNDTVQMRLSVVPPRSARDRLERIAERDGALIVGRGKEAELVRIRAGEPYPEVMLAADLGGGSVRDYPFDRFFADMSFALLDAAPSTGSTRLPLRVTIWEGMLGWHLRAQSTSAGLPELAVRLSIARTGATAFFACAIYAAMAAMALCALAIGTLVFAGVRRIEVTLLGAFGAMIFAMPALRNAMPGSPPLGVRGDVLIFFWAEIALVCVLCLFIAAWIRRGPEP